MTPSISLSLWGTGFLVHHLAASHPPVRKLTVRILGERGHQALYGLVALGLFVPWVAGWWQQRWTVEPSWHLPGPLEAAAAFLGIAGFALLAAGAARPAPSSLVAPSACVDGASGIHRVTRHPVNLGLACWGLTHLVANATVIDLAFFGPLTATAILGTLHQDWRKSRASEDYRAFTRESPFLPDLQAFATLETRDWIALSVGTFVGIVLHTLHPLMFGGLRP